MNMGMSTQSDFPAKMTEEILWIDASLGTVHGEGIKKDQKIT